MKRPYSTGLAVGKADGYRFSAQRLQALADQAAREDRAPTLNEVADLIRDLNALGDDFDSRAKKLDEEVQKETLCAECGGPGGHFVEQINAYLHRRCMDAYRHRHNL